MANSLVLCDGAEYRAKGNENGWDNRIAIFSRGNSTNLNLKFENLSSALLNPLDPLSSDLVRIASYIYAADQKIPRGSVKDVYGTSWTRKLHFIIPVSDPSKWSKPEVKDALVDTIGFLTGDSFSFDFVLGAPAITQEKLLDNNSMSNDEMPDCVILFSGGSDSLCAVVEKVICEGRHPILVSHRSLPLTDSRQANLVNLLRKYFPQWYFPRISVWVSLQGAKAEEYTQRSRSFLYCCLAIAVCGQTGTKEIFLADNGVVSLNPPTNAQLVGTTASRTTHPKFLSRIQNFANKLYENKFSITNPLQYRTRPEILEILKANNCLELLEETVSCAHSRQTKMSPHCGVCSQCVDRRFATVAANLEAYDPVDRYKVDIFKDAIEDGVDKTLVVSYVRFAQEIEHMTPEEIFRKYSELEDCILPEDQNAAETASKLADLLHRHASQVSLVVKEKLSKNANLIYEATLPESCLIRLIASGKHTQSPQKDFAARIAGRLQRGLPKAFQSHKPNDEKEVQEVINSILAGASEDLDRELPLMPFASVSTKPDFSNSDSGTFYIEVKFVKTRARLNSIVTEITSRILIYKKQFAYTLFAVYDPNHFIDSDENFVKDLAGDKHLVAIIR